MPTSCGYARSATGKRNLTQIVTRRPRNAQGGIKVVLARPGTIIPATGEALKIGTIRGVESRGMMCSARELLLGEDHDGIIELKPGAKPGEPVIAALVDAGLLADDPLFDVSITPNRGDAASVFGIARDLAASGLGTLKTEKVTPVPGKFPQPQEDHPRLHTREQKCLPDLFGPADPWREEWPRAAMGARPL